MKIRIKVVYDEMTNYLSNTLGKIKFYNQGKLHILVVSHTSKKKNHEN